MSDNRCFRVNGKTIFTFLIVLLMYALPIIIFNPNEAFYLTLNGATVPFWVYVVMWIVATMALAMFVTLVMYKSKHCASDDDKYGYKRLFLYLILNYIFGAAFIPTFFLANNLFLSYVLAIADFITIIFVLMEVYMIKKCYSYWIIPYAIWTAFLSVMTVILYLKS